MRVEVLNVGAPMLETAPIGGDAGPLQECSSIGPVSACVTPRYVAMLLTKMLTHPSLPEIGRLFGRRGHTTVLHAVGHTLEPEPIPSN